MRLGESQEKGRKKNPYEMINKGVIWLRNGLAAAGGAVLLVKGLPAILKDTIKKQ